MTKKHPPDRLIVAKARTLEKLLAKLKARYFYTDNLIAVNLGGRMSLVSGARELSGYEIHQEYDNQGRSYIVCTKALGFDSPRKPVRPKKPKPSNP